MLGLMWHYILSEIALCAQNCFKKDILSILRQFFSRQFCIVEHELHCVFIINESTRSLVSSIHVQTPDLLKHHHHGPPKTNCKITRYDVAEAMI